MKYPTQEELLEITLNDRLKLIEDIWDTLERDPNSFPLSEDEAREIDRRLEAFEKNPEAGETWDEVRRRITTK